MQLGHRLGSWDVFDQVFPGDRRYWRVRHQQSGEEGVLRFFPPGLPNQEAALRLGEALDVLDHRSIPSRLDAGITRSGEAWVVMEAFEGRTLGDLAASQPLPVEELVPLLLPIGDALKHVHDRGLVHRDVQPEHLLIDADDRAWIIGFELAMPVQALRLHEDPPFGPLGYVAPEVIQDHDRHGTRADLYSLGVVLYEVITGRAAFPAAMVDAAGDPRRRVFEWKTRSAALDPKDHAPAWLGALVRRMTDPDPDRRLPDMDAFLGWLEAARASWAPPPPPVVAPVAPLPVMMPSLALAPPPPVVVQQVGPPPALYTLAAAALGMVTGLAFSAVVILFSDAG